MKKAIEMNCTIENAIADKYFLENYDRVLYEIKDEEKDGCVYIMLGYDMDKESYYIVYEDEFNSKDIYVSLEEIQHEVSKLLLKELEIKTDGK